MASRRGRDTHGQAVGGLLPGEAEEARDAGRFSHGNSCECRRVHRLCRSGEPRSVRPGRARSSMTLTRCGALIIAFAATLSACQSKEEKAKVIAQALATRSQQ